LLHQHWRGVNPGLVRRLFDLLYGLYGMYGMYGIDCPDGHEWKTLRYKHKARLSRHMETSVQWAKMIFIAKDTLTLYFLLFLFVVSTTSVIHPSYYLAAPMEQRLPNPKPPSDTCHRT